MKGSKKFSGYTAAVGAFLVVFTCLGAANTLGTFLQTLVDYTGYSLAKVSYIGTINTVGNIILSLVALKLIDKISARWTMLIAVICCAAHFWLYTAVTPGHGLMYMYAAGLLASGAIAFGTHAVAQNVIASWFIEKRETICGWCFTGAGLGGAAWIFLAGQLFKYFDFKVCYRILSIPVVILGFVAVFFLVKDPVKLGQKPLGWEKAEQLAKERAEAEQKLIGVDRKDVFKHPAFYLMAVAVVICVLSNCEILCYFAAYLQSKGLDATTAANWYSLYFILAGVSAWLTGKVADKFGAKAFTILTHVACCLTGIMLILWSKNLSTAMLILAVLFGGLAYPMQTNIPAMITQSVFGPRDFARISSLFMVFVYMGQFITAPIMTIFLNSSAGMEGCWTMISITSIIGIVLIMITLKISPMKVLLKGQEACDES